MRKVFNIFGLFGWALALIAGASIAVAQVPMFQGTKDYLVNWTAPGGQRTLTIPDPGGNDTFVFLAATQTFTGKTLTNALFNGTAPIAATQTVATSGSPIGIAFTGAAHTTLTASAEANDVQLNLGRIVQFATGALTNQRAVSILAPTYAFVGASTLSNAATVAIDQAPIAGTNATLTRSVPLWIDFAKTTPAAGSATQGILFGSAPAVGIFYGSGAPTLSAPQGSIYMRTDGSSTSTRMYVNQNGSTTWTNVTTGA